MIEIERKFTVVADFAANIEQALTIRQGYLRADHQCAVRVRITADAAFLTIKGPLNERRLGRHEFEYRIPTGEAEELIKLCPTGIIDKTRYFVREGKHLWEVDEFHGRNEGLLIAEIELEDADETFDLPPWIGDEVTSDPRYYNAMLAQKPYSQWENRIDYLHKILE
jgi:CYTH domain-containing protein